MKNKKNIRILLPLVVAIWALLIYKMVDAFSDDSNPVAQTQIGSFKAPDIKPKEEFSLLAVESDPFLGTVYKKKRKKTSGATSSAPKKDIAWPTIQYLGLVADGGSSDKVFIISINGQQQLIRSGETLENVKVIRGNKEKITLRFEGQTQEFSIM
ncbi:hypothetical protein POV27_14240 [Aureisphaera galaxeae]|uniref:hypothetical protein n=1 Tax=Aureisphaera galaxeae TaxID=1538023 RepID=UPI00234FD8C8|nr:hypothetical protein [Aureisphaera galaxeae]MDC8005217.1 hypothetical protein [Aureisphaera galaxeae]